jgi:AbrB family looped-hinge helix DNA binding protein
MVFVCDTVVFPDAALQCDFKFHKRSYFYSWGDIISMGKIMGMGKRMGKVEVDDRGRVTIPAAIRKKLNLKPGDKLSIEIDEEKGLRFRKPPTKEEIFENLVGCITRAQKKQPSISEIKGIWKTKPQNP